MIENIDKLRLSVEKAFGENVTTSKHCVQLEKSIFEKTQRSLSAATLRRFFGLLSSVSNPSKYTRETLALYSSSANQMDGINHVDTIWDDCKKEAESYTTFYINSIKKLSVTDFDRSIRREPIEKLLSNFIDSDDIYTSISAPGGYGKSTLLAKWLEQPNNSINEEDIVLFTNAMIFENTFQKYGQKTKYLNFSLNSSNTFEQIQSSGLVKGKFILIVDAVDELSLHVDKLKSFINWFITLLTQTNELPWIKIILSVRAVIYEKQIFPLFQKHLSKSYASNTKLQFLENRITVPLLNPIEIVRVVRRQMSDCAFSPIFDHVSNPNILLFLQKPLHLVSYLLNVLGKEDQEEVYSFSLYEELFNRTFVRSTSSEEKIEIIEWILADRIKNNSSFVVNKNQLKKQYPIHLKQEWKYYQAYNELIKEGVFNEYLHPDKFGIPSYVIAFNHVSYYYYLCAIYLLKQNDGLTLDLLLKVQNEFENLEFKINIIGLMFNYAYKNEQIDVLKDIYSLDEDIISSNTMSVTIGICLRRKNKIQKELISCYAQQEKSQHYLFESFVDINSLILGFNDQIFVYEKYKKTNEARMFASLMHMYHDLLTLNLEGATSYYNKIETIECGNDFPPKTLGRKAGYEIMYHTFCNRNSAKLTLEEIIDSRQFAYRNFPFGCQKEYLFDITVVLALALSKQYQMLLDYCAYIIKEVEVINKSEEFSYYAQDFHNDVIQCLCIFANYKLTSKFDTKDIDQLSLFPAKNASHYSSYQYSILIGLYTSELLLQTGDKTKAFYYLDLALIISSDRKYDLFKAYVLTNSSLTSSKQQLEGRQMIEDSGFIMDVFQPKTGNRPK